MPPTTPPANLNDPAQVQAGAREYAEHGCVTCHGGPGAQWAKFSEGLHPDPPDLKEVAKELPPSQLFFVIKNGINMTGMPSFGAGRHERRRNLVDRGLCESAARRQGCRLQGLDRAACRQPVAPAPKQ